MKGHSGTARKSLVVKGFGGLGNRLLTLMNAIAVCVSERRDLYIDWSDDTYSEDRVNVFPQLFNLNRIPLCSCTLQDFPPDSAWPPAWSGQLGKTSRELMFEYIQREVDGYSAFEKQIKFLHRIRDKAGEVVVITHELGDPVITFCDLGVLPWSACFGRDHAFGRLFRRFLEPAESVRRTIERVQCDMAPGVAVGVHVRASDNPVDSHHEAGAYFDLVDRIRSESRFSKIYLATDNRAVLDTFARRYGADLVFLKQWLPESPGQRAHANDDCPDKLQHARCSLVDLLVLSEINSLVVNAESSFSRLATQIGTEDKSVWQVNGGGTVLSQYPNLFLRSAKGCIRSYIRSKWRGCNRLMHS